MRTLGMVLGLALSMAEGTTEGGNGTEAPERPHMIEPPDAKPNDPPAGVNPDRVVLTASEAAAAMVRDAFEKPAPGDAVVARAQVYRPPNSDEALENRYMYHAPKSGQPERYAKVRRAICDVAKLCRDLTPTCAEQTRAFNALDDAMFLFNAAIARNE